MAEVVGAPGGLLVGLMAAQFLVHAAGWTMAAVMQRRADGAEGHFALFWLALAVALAAHAAAAAGALAGAAEAATLLAALAVHRGVVVFYRRPPPDRRYGALLALALAACVAAAAAGLPGLGVAAVSLLVAVLAFATAFVFWTEGRQRTRTLALALVLALVATALVMLLRAAAAWSARGTPARPGTLELAWGVALFLLAGFFNLAQIRLVLGRVLRRLVAETQRDPLTGLANRRGFTASLQAVHRRAQRGGESYGLLMVDIDHFKRLNDEHGHAAGDAALRELAHLLKATVRARDIVGRLGGEEFCVLLPGCDLAGASGLADRVCVAVAGGSRVTVSVGVALVHPGGEAAEAALARADAALYRAKHAGRNRVVVAA